MQALDTTEAGPAVTPRALARRGAGRDGVPARPGTRTAVPLLFGLVLVTTIGLVPALAQTDPTPRDVSRSPSAHWFSQLSAPIVLPASAWQELTAAAYTGLKTGRLPSELPGPVAADTGVRAVFLSWTSGEQRATVSLGFGEGLGDALRAACAQPAAASAGDLRWLKLDVVQHAFPIEEYYARRSSVPHPSLFGLAFWPFRCFAFLPEELVSWDLTDAQGRLAVHAIGEYLAAVGRLSDALKWSRLCSFAGPVGVHLFESESYFQDEQLSVPLFRGHRVLADLSVAQVMASASRAGDFMVRSCSDTGEIDVPFPEWHTGPDGTATLRDHAGAALALVTLYGRTGQRSFLAAAERIAGRLQRAVQPYAPDPKAGCVVEYRLSSLDTNALTVLALLALRESTATEGRYTKTLDRLSLYLLHQLQPGGEFIRDRVHPSGNIEPDVSLSASSIAVLALVRLYEKTARAVFLRAAEKGMNGLLASDVEGREMDELPRDEWFLSALNAYFTYTREPRLVQLVERVALGIVSTQAHASDFPDLLGSVIQHPSATTAARRTRGLAVAAQLLLDTGRDQAASELLACARLSLVFQLQAQLDPPTAMYLAKPTAYVGAFRDHILDYGLALHCQYVQVLSLLEAAKAAEQAAVGAFPYPAKFQASFDAAWAGVRCFPRFLPQRPAPGMGKGLRPMGGGLPR